MFPRPPGTVEVGKALVEARGDRERLALRDEVLAIDGGPELLGERSGIGGAWGRASWIASKRVRSMASRLWRRERWLVMCSRKSAWGGR